MPERFLQNQDAACDCTPVVGMPLAFYRLWLGIKISGSGGRLSCISSHGV